MGDIPTKLVWVGPDGPRDIEEMSRGELIEQLRYAVRQLEFYQQPVMARALALGSVELLKRGET